MNHSILLGALLCLLSLQSLSRDWNEHRFYCPFLDDRKIKESAKWTIYFNKAFWKPKCFYNTYITFEVVFCVMIGIVPRRNVWAILLFLMNQTKILLFGLPKNLHACILRTFIPKIIPKINKPLTFTVRIPDVYFLANRAGGEVHKSKVSRNRRVGLKYPAINEINVDKFEPFLAREYRRGVRSMDVPDAARPAVTWALSVGGRSVRRDGATPSDVERAGDNVASEEMNEHVQMIHTGFLLIIQRRPRR